MSDYMDRLASIFWTGLYESLRFPAVLVVLLVGLPGPGAAQDPPGPRLDGEDRRAVIDRLSDVLRDNYVFPELAERMASSLRERLRRGEYDRIDDARSFSDSLSSHLYEIGRDHHLGVSFDPGPFPEPSQPPVADDREARRARLSRVNFGFRKTEILSGNVGYLEITTFAPAELAGDAAHAAMRFLSHTEALIVDVRSGPGGHPDMVVLLASYLFEPEPVHLWDLYRRVGDRTERSWTLRDLPGDRLITQPVFILTGSRTFSASEALAYTLKHLGRATIVGERTGGGAHAGRKHRISEDFTVFVPNSRPISPVTGTNWQGVGVSPDIGVASELALDTAYLRALEALLDREEDPTRAAELERVRAEVRERLREASESLRN